MCAEDLLESMVFGLLGWSSEGAKELWQERDNANIYNDHREELSVLYSLCEQRHPPGE